MLVFIHIYYIGINYGLKIIIGENQFFKIRKLYNKCNALKCTYV